jgi:hypothetical protein
VASTVGRGVLLGIGFGVAIGACVLFGAPLIKSKIDADFRALDRSYRAQISDIVLSDVVAQKGETSLSILGRASNIGEKPAPRVGIQVNFFSSGQFVDQCEGNVSEWLEPGTESYFKISCICNNNRMIEYDSFNAVVLRSYWP